MRFWVEDRSEVLPFAGVAVAWPAFGEFAQEVALYCEVMGAVVADGMEGAGIGREGVEVGHFDFTLDLDLDLDLDLVDSLVGIGEG